MSLCFDFLACWGEKENGQVWDDNTIISAAAAAAEEISKKGVSTELSLSWPPSGAKDMDHEDNDDGVCLTLRLSPPGSSLSSGTPCGCKRNTPPWVKRSRTSKKKDDTPSQRASEGGDSGVHQSPFPRAGLGKGGGERPWVKKMLSASDVNSSSRLLLPKAEIMDRYVLPSLDKEKESACHSAMGLKVKVTDMDDGKECVLTLLQWKSGSYVLTNNWSEKFVRRRKLKEGDSIELCWNAQNLEFLFRKSTNADNNVPGSA